MKDVIVWDTFAELKENSKKNFIVIKVGNFINL
jgi:hypothetical protein